MARPVVGVELISLARQFQRLFELGDMLGRRVLVICTKQAEQGTGEILGQMNDRADLERVSFGRSSDDESAVTVDRGVELKAAPARND